MQNTVKYLHHVHCRFYVLISAEAKQICMYQYDKNLRIHDYIQNININVVYLLLFLNFIWKTTLTICNALIVDFKCLYMQKQIFIYLYEKVSMKYFKNL